LFTSLTYLLEIIMDTQAIIDGIMQRLVDTIADEVMRKLQAQGAAEATLAPETLAASLLHLLEFDADIREAVRDCTDEKFNDVDRRFDELENSDNGNHIDADNSEFDSAVMQVLRNNI
jgi:hypothetical protein